MAGVFAIGVVGAMPSRGDVRLMADGTRQLDAGEMAAAEVTFARAVLREPRSAKARLGLACAFLHMGHRDRALIELALAAERGLVLSVVGRCGPAPEPGDIFVSARSGLVDTLVVPADGDPETIARLRRPVLPTRADEGRRVLLAACLSYRAGLDSAGWWYLVSASARHLLTPDGSTVMSSCLRQATRVRLSCPAGARTIRCLLDGPTWAAYAQDRGFLFPRDRPPRLVALASGSERP